MSALLEELPPIDGFRTDRLEELTVKEESYLDARERFPIGRIRIKYSFETVAVASSAFARSPSALIRQRSVSAEAHVR